MKRLFLIAATFSALTLINSPLCAQPICKSDSLPQLPDVSILSVTQEIQGGPHCKVEGVIGSEIHFELLLPEQWNGKFVFGGGGGFVGSVVNVAASLYGAIQSGYATVGTDTGHQAHSLDASWALNNMERIVNFGNQAVHRTVVTAKALIKAYYQREIERNYFIGCSRGGGQALMEAQRYPEDFDGIVAGAPAYNWTMGLGAGMTQNMKAMFPDPNDLEEAVIGSNELKLIESSYLEICDELDGIKDGILNDPRLCRFDVATLLCKGEKTNSCLSEEQVEAVKTVYEGPKDSKGNPLFYGFPFGGETGAGGWDLWIAGGLKYQGNEDYQAGMTSDFPIPKTPNAMYAFGTNVMKYLIHHDPDWTYTDYNYDNLHKDARLVESTLNATDPNLTAFRKRGGKLILFSGWADAGITALGTIGYYESVIEQDKSAANDVRLFMMPGVWHCFGGPGPSYTNFLAEIDKWIETGKAPEQTAAFWLDDRFQPAGSRLLCAYPKVTKYDGKGDPRDVSSFSCIDDE